MNISYLNQTIYSIKILCNKLQLHSAIDLIISAKYRLVPAHIEAVEARAILQRVANLLPAARFRHDCFTLRLLPEFRGDCGCS